MKVSAQGCKGFAGMVFLLMVMLAAPVSALAHCDTLDGPVVETARTALEKGDVTSLLKWVKPDQEAAIKTAFAQTLAIRKMGPEAKDFSDRYFFETLVRIHRAGEGAPYTGLKPGTAVDPAVALADQALANGSVDKLVSVLTNAMGQEIRARFASAYEKQKKAEVSVDEGREFVESFVVLTHYVEGLHGLIKADAGHHGKSLASTESKHGH
ncbi:MAG: DUF6448 family protein [Desulfuromonadales bacterium]